MGTCFAQNAFYWGDGKLISQDSLKKFKSIKEMILSQGPDETGIKIVTLTNPKTKKSYLTSVWYVPFIHKPILIGGGIKGDYQSIIKKFNADNYNSRGFGFSTDFDLLKNRPEVDDKFIVNLIGKPDSIESNSEYHNGETYHYYKNAFELIFEDGKLAAYKAYDFKGARVAGFGVSDFKINLSESGDYVTGFSVNYSNFSRKRIKYIFTTINAINGVGDLVQSRISKSIGPIEPNESGSYNFDSLFFSQIIDKERIAGIKVQYFDGTIKIFNRTQLATLFIN